MNHSDRYPSYIKKEGGAVFMAANKKRSYLKYLRKKFNVVKKITDPRKWKFISLRTVVESLLVLPLMGAHSLLEIDLMFRMPGVRKLFKGESISDTHLSRLIPRLDTEEIRKVIHEVSTNGNERYRIGDKPLRIGSIDGTCMMKRYICCLQQLTGEKERVILDIEPYSIRGKELPATKRLLKRNQEAVGDGYFDLILGDPLYMSQHHFNQCLSYGADVLVKTKDDTLDIIKDAQGIFENRDEFGEEIEYVEGVDLDRNIEYKITACGGFEWNKVKVSLKVACIEEENLKTGEKTVYYVVTTKDDLTPMEMRELSYLRWSIENHGFKLLNALVNSKHGYIRDEKRSSNLILLLILGFNLFMQFLEDVWGKLKKAFPKLTIKHCARTLMISELPGQQCILTIPVFE